MKNLLSVLFVIISVLYVHSTEAAPTLKSVVEDGQTQRELVYQCIERNLDALEDTYITEYYVTRADWKYGSWMIDVEYVYIEDNVQKTEQLQLACQ